jgi:hypothetical protein
MISDYSLQQEVSTSHFDNAISVVEQLTNISVDGDSGFNTSSAPSPEMLGGGPEPLSDFSKAFISLLYAIVTVVAVGGNAIVCCIVATQRRMQTVTNFFIASLACSDALMASLCIPLSFVTNVIIDYWPFGAVMCPVTQYSQVSLLRMTFHY